MSTMIQGAKKTLVWEPVSEEERAQHREATDLLFANIRQAMSDNMEKIVRALNDGDIAVLFYEVGGEHEESHPEMHAASGLGARELGWRGGRVEVGRMNKTRARRLADAIEKDCPSDRAAIAWLRCRSNKRIFACVHYGTFCFDLDEQGLRLVPGTLDWEFTS